MAVQKNINAQLEIAIGLIKMFFFRFTMAVIIIAALTTTCISGNYFHLGTGCLNN